MSRGSRAHCGRSEPPQPGMSGTITRQPREAKSVWKGSQPGLPQLWWSTTTGPFAPASAPLSSSFTLPVASATSRSS